MNRGLVVNNIGSEGEVPFKRSVSWAMFPSTVWSFLGRIIRAYLGDDSRVVPRLANRRQTQDIRGIAIAWEPGNPYFPPFFVEVRNVVVLLGARTIV